MTYDPYDRDKQQRVAQTKVRAVPTQGQQRVANPGAGPTGNPLQQAALGLGKKALMGAAGSALGPFGAILGGLFNKGGKVQGYSLGGEVEDEKQKKRADRKREAAARGEYEVADWFFTGDKSKVDPRFPGNFGRTGEGAYGAGYEWRNEPNRKLRDFQAAFGDNFDSALVTPQAYQADTNKGNYISSDKPFYVDRTHAPEGAGLLEALLYPTIKQGFYNPENFDHNSPRYNELVKDYEQYNEGGQVGKKKSWWDTIWGSKSGKEGSFRDQSNWGGHQNKNMGGPISGNPYMYNEGGPVMGTPIKKVMDEDKLESQMEMAVIKEDQAERAFAMEQERKDKLLQQQLQQKEDKHNLDMKLKKESATMKTPLSK